MQRIEITHEINTLEDINLFNTKELLCQLIKSEEIPGDIQVRIRQIIEVRNKPPRSELLYNDWGIQSSLLVSR